MKLGTIICGSFYTLVGFYILLGGVHGRVVDGEHARRRLRFYGAEDELAGAVGLLAQEKVEEGELVHVVRDFHFAALQKKTKNNWSTHGKNYNLNWLI